MSNLIISELVIYPVKSMRQVLINKAQIDIGGLKNDRRWMVVDVARKMITQRQQSRLCLIQPELTNDGIRLMAEGYNVIDVAIPDEQTKVNVFVWKDTCGAYDAGTHAANWLSDFLGMDCRLMYYPDDEFRLVDQTYASENDRTAFSDGFPVLLISQASLDDLNTRLPSPVPMSRFRPNIVISGCEPYEEDEWQLLQIGDVKLRIVKPCSRCVIPSIDINTAERTGEPTKTLSGYRRRDNKIMFGQNAVIDGSGVLKVGASAQILK